MTTVPASLARSGRGFTWAAWSVLAASVLACTVYVTFSSAVVGLVVFGLVAGVTIVSIVVGLAAHRPAAVLPWRLVLTASVLFLVGGLSRAVARDLPDEALPVVAVLATVGGYLAVGGAATVWLRARAAGTGVATALDAVLVGTAAALVGWVVLVAPPASRATDVGLLINASYPIVDAVLLTLLVQLVFTSAPGDRAFALLTTCVVAILVGDLGYAATTANLLTLPERLLDTPYLVGYCALAAAALHPSMAELARPQPPLEYRGRRRLPGLVAGLVAAAVILALDPTTGSIDRIVRAVLFGLLLLGVLLRSERAVRRHAEGERVARHRSTHDELTGLPNRVLLNQRVQAELDTSTGAERVSLLFIDLDGFKFVNDVYGHSVGDELLVQAAQRLSESVRPQDLVSRYGGDEFVLAVQLGRAGTDGLADRLVTVLSEPFGLSVGSVFVSASVGIARASGRDGGDEANARDEVENLIRQADTAMYHAKAQGRGGYARYDDSLRESARLQVETSTALRDALARGEFDVHYQPIVDLRDGRTLGWEALLRWERDGQQVSPAVFIPIAEASDIIVRIGDWVLRTACEQLARWRHDSGRRLHVSVNISARQLQDFSLPRTVAEVLATTGLPGEALWLELTETALVEDPTTALGVLDALHDLGVVICLDDFGTGYSALGYLHRFPVSVVKIDGSFVQVLDEADPESTVAGAVQSMSVALGLRTVAEGVETQLQEVQLRRLGCHMAQGFRFGRPAPAAEIEVAHEVS
ncbi:MAG: EAL domain-containing protein [Mycobacteriaceae bacterium]